MESFLIIGKDPYKLPLFMSTSGSPIIPSVGDTIILVERTCVVTKIVWLYDERQINVVARWVE